MTRQPAEPAPPASSRTTPQAESARTRPAVSVLVVSASLLLTLALVEVASRIVIATGLIDAPPPTSDSSFWDPDHEQLGVWHVPGSSSNQGRGLELELELELQLELEVKPMLMLEIKLERELQVELESDDRSIGRAVGGSVGESVGRSVDECVGRWVRRRIG